MSEHRRLVEKMIHCYNTMNAAELESVLHPEARHSDPISEEGSDLRGRPAIIAYLGGKIFPKFRTVHFDLTHIWEDPIHSVITAEWNNLLET